MDESLVAQTVPTGGAVSLDFSSTDTGTWTLTRAVQAAGGATSNEYTLFSQAASPTGAGFWIDMGDGTAAQLNQSTTYLYTFSTASGSATATVQPAQQMQLIYDDYTVMLIKLLKAAVVSAQPPDGISLGNRPQVLYAMPLTSTPALPIISVSEVLLQQWKTGIGHGLDFDWTKNYYDVSEQVHRRYQVTVMARDPESREFLKQLVLATFKVILGPVLTRMGQNVSSDFQASSNQVTDPSPGFYYCDISLNFSGVFSTGVKTNFGVVESFDAISDVEAVIGDPILLEQGVLDLPDPPIG